MSRAGLVPVMALAQRAALGELVAEHVRVGRRCGVNAHLKVPCLAAGMIAGADSDNPALVDEVETLQQAIVRHLPLELLERPSDSWRRDP